MLLLIKSLIHQFSQNTKKLFLIDALGACLTAFFTGIVLIQFENWFGMPKNVLAVLSLIAGGFAVYSFCCSAFISGKWRSYLTIIIIANILYGCSTIVLVIYFYQQLTLLGLLYFLLELIVLSALVFLEYKVLVFNSSALKNSSKKNI